MTDKAERSKLKIIPIPLAVIFSIVIHTGMLVYYFSSALLLITILAMIAKYIIKIIDMTVEISYKVILMPKSKK